MSSPGRPSAYTQELADEVCERMAGGESLNAICKDAHMPHERTVRRWMLDNVEGFSPKYTRARELQAEFWADDILRLSDESRIGEKVKTGPNGEEKTTGDMVERTRLQVESRKWLLSKLFPKKYGDKIEVEQKGEVTVKHKWGA